MAISREQQTMTTKLAKLICKALNINDNTSWKSLYHNYMVLSGDKVNDICSAIEETFPNIDSDYAYETAFHAING